MMSLLLSLAIEGGAIGVVTGPDSARPPVVQAVPPPPDTGAAFQPPAGPSGVTPPDQARQEAQVARQVQKQMPGSRVLQVETRDGAHHVRVLHNGQVRVVVVPQ